MKYVKYKKLNSHSNKWNKVHLVSHNIFEKGRTCSGKREFKIKTNYKQCEMQQLFIMENIINKKMNHTDLSIEDYFV